MKRIKNKVKAVIFDMDGTILKTEHLWDQATRQVLHRRGFKKFSNGQLATLESLSGIGLEESSKVLKKEFKLSDSIDTLTQETKKTVHTLFETKLEFIDGFELFHEKLQLHLISTSIASNADASSITLLNKKMNLHRFFGDNIYSIESVGNVAKPNPDIFLHAADQLSVQPKECVVFEDSIFGFKAADAAGMKCIAIKNNCNKNCLKLVCKAINSYHEAEKALVDIHLSSNN